MDGISFAFSKNILTQQKCKLKGIYQNVLKLPVSETRSAVSLRNWSGVARN